MSGLPRCTIVERIDCTSLALPQGARLRALWDKHREHPYLRPMAEHTVQAFAQWQEWLASRTNTVSKLILDGCCGKGESTMHLAALYPDHFVLGVDQSAARLGAAPHMPANAMILRAELGDIWRLACEHNLRFDKQFLLYPNPYPKSEHLQRRWHAHPLFAAGLQCCGELELRSNKRYYAEESALVLGYAGWQVDLDRIAVEAAFTAFERKYSAAGEELWRVRARSAKTPAIESGERRAEP